MATVSTAEYDVFISYSRKDRAHAIALETLLVAQGLTPFRDERNLGIGEHVDVALPAAHRRSASVVVLWSDNSAASKWVYNEAIGAVFGEKYLPLLIDGLLLFAIFNGEKPAELAGPSSIAFGPCRSP